MRFLSLMLMGACLLLAACADRPAQEAMPGADRDAHGCIPSAGYRWCERTRQCERPWELADKQGFEKTVQAFDGYCSGPDDRKLSLPEDDQAR